MGPGVRRRLGGRHLRARHRAGRFITGFDLENGQVAGGPFLWLTPFNLTVGVCLVGGYALLGATWLIMKTDGLVQERAYAQAFTLAILVAVGMGLISASTPLTHPEVAARWFAWPNFFLLLPVPLVTVWAWISSCAASAIATRSSAPSSSAWRCSRWATSGWACRCGPISCRRHLTIWDAAAPPTSQGFLLVGVVILIPMILAYTAYSYWVFRGKVRGRQRLPLRDDQAARMRPRAEPEGCAGMTETSKPAQAAADPAERMAAMQRIGEKSRRVAELWLSKGGRPAAARCR